MTSVSDIMWKTKRGTSIRIGDMTDRHLENALAMVKLQRDKWDGIAMAAACPNVCSPDSMAAYYAEHEMNEALDRVSKYEACIEVLEAEKKLRKIPVDA